MPPIDATTLEGYRRGQTLAADERLRLVRAVRLHDGAKVLLEIPLEHPLDHQASQVARAALARQQQLLGSLAVDGVAQPLGVITGDIDGGTDALVFDDHDTRTMAALLGAGPMPLAWVLDVAEQLVGVLAQLHRCGIVHRGLRPAAIWVDGPASRLRLADFSEAARDAAEAALPLAPALYGSRLAYAAPETIGRIGRGCDHRSDFYALGVTLYECLSAQLPFCAADPLELVHAHLAKLPRPLTELLPSLPEPVSQIVLKLLAKSPDDRYQSARALQRDLQRCRHEWSERGSVAAFHIAERDVPERFAIPQRLYGRDDELRALLACYDAARLGPARLALVAGPAGVGKTALVRALQEAVTRSNGRFVSGKFDQLSLGLPYRALAQALDQLLQLLLAEPAAQLELQRRRLAGALGIGAAVLAECVPQLPTVLGAQPAAPPLPAAEAKNRLTLALCNFIATLATAERPLLIFLDDLQWADAASLQLLMPLLASQVRHLLVVGALRDHDLERAFALRAALAELRGSTVLVERITLRALALPALARLTADTLRIDAERALPLARLLLEKTDGNPFFVGQFLLALHKEGLIAFDAEHACWDGALAQIANAAITDNVVELMSRKIARLAPATQRVLTLAACIGNRFDLATLCVVSGQSAQAVASDLADCVLEGLIVRQAEQVFVFVHDRIQQAAYARLAGTERPEAHLRIGRLLRAHGLSERERERGDELLFELASHLNLGAALITAHDERIELARIDLAAGRKAKLASAHAAALGFFEAGAGLLDSGNWHSQHELAFDLHLDAAQSLYLCGRFDAADAACVRLLARAASGLERARVYGVRMLQFENRGRYADALDSARAGLLQLGVALPLSDLDKEPALTREIAAIEARIGDRPIAGLIDLPTMTDPAMRMVMGMLSDIWSATYILGDALLARLISALLVRLSLQHGNCEESAYGYVTHAITVGPVRGDYAGAYEFGRLALQVNERFDDRRLRAKIHQQFHAHVNLWCRPMHSCIAHAREAWRSGLESGDFLYAAYGASTQSWPAIVSCQDLQACVRELTPNVALVEQLRNAPFADALRLVIAWAQALRGQTESALSLSCSGEPDREDKDEFAFDEQAYVDTYRGNPFFTMFHAIAKLHLAYLLGEMDQAHVAARSVRGTAHQLVGMVWSVLFDFWNGLTLAARLHLAADDDERAAWLGEIEAAQRKLATLARSCAANFACHAALLDAQLQRIGGHTLQAMQCHEAALAAAETSGDVQQQALANELYAQHWLGHGNRSIAALYLRRALAHYTRWGAQAKVQALQRQHGAWLAEVPDGPDAPPSNVAALAGDALAQLDLAAIVKAAHAIAEPLHPDALIERLLAIAIEHAGARRGVMVEELDGELRLVALGSADAGAHGLRCALPLDDADAGCCRAAVRYVQRTRRNLVIGDVARDERFANDEWVLAQRPLSMLCLPIACQGALAAILCLEHDLLRDAFSPRRIEVLQLLLAQAAISLHNARLAQRAREAVHERERAMHTLRVVEAGTGSVTGEDFFRALVRNLAQALRVRYAFVAECVTGAAGAPSARMRALWAGDDFAASLPEYPLAGTPCEGVVAGATCHYAADVQSLFPQDRDLVDADACSYLGLPLLASSGEVIGHMALLDTASLPDATLATTVLRLSAGRAGAELERVRATEGLQRALVEVQQLRDRLQQENVYLRRDLIANVSHDLRSPLASLRGYLDTLLLKGQALGVDEQRKCVAIAARQAQQLQSLIDELFELARLDFQGCRISAEPLQLGELAHDVVQKFQLAAQHKGITLRTDGGAGLPFVSADIALLERALSNLIDNALAHTGAGGTVELRLASDESRQVRIGVVDSGCGIAAADLPHVFERFYRADKARSRGAGGCGLGLAIVKRIVELHGAQVQVDSRVGVGTRFWFTLNAIDAAAACGVAIEAREIRSSESTPLAAPR